MRCFNYKLRKTKIFTSQLNCKCLIAGKYEIMETQLDKSKVRTGQCMDQWLASTVDMNSNGGEQSKPRKAMDLFRPATD